MGFSQISRKTVREALDRNSSGDRGTQLLETQREALSQLAVDPATVVVERADRCYGVSGLCPAEREHVDGFFVEGIRGEDQLKLFGGSLVVAPGGVEAGQR